MVRISARVSKKQPAPQTALVAFLLALSMMSPIGPSPAPAGVNDVLLLEEDFESGISRWSLDNADSITIVSEPDSDGNRVLLLTPEEDTFTHAILEESSDWSDIRVEGRFLFPSEGDGYLGLIYNYQQMRGDDGLARMDFGCIYIKSNGSYVRVSPHYDGNPSWRLYEEYRFDLVGDRRIEVGRWYEFRLDVRGRAAELFIEDMSVPVVRFEQTPNASGAIGLEARPGGGEPVWVDDVRVSELSSGAGAVRSPATSQSAGRARGARWEILGPFDSEESFDFETPELAAGDWQSIRPDPHGLFITGRTTQYRSGDHDVAYLRTRFGVSELQAAPTWLAISSANRLDVWLNGYYRGTVAGESFIWSDYLTSKTHPGARIPLLPDIGENKILIRVHGRRFAGGGLYLDLLRPPEDP